jgi:hypothetical protein
MGYSDQPCKDSYLPATALPVKAALKMRHGIQTFINCQVTVPISWRFTIALRVGSFTPTSYLWPNLLRSEVNPHLSSSFAVKSF